MVKELARNMQNIRLLQWNANGVKNKLSYIL